MCLCDVTVDHFLVLALKLNAGWTCADGPLGQQGFAEGHTPEVGYPSCKNDVGRPLSVEIDGCF